MSSINALERYTVAQNKMKQHIEANKAVFDAHQALVMASIDARNELEDEMSTDLTPISNADFKVKAEPFSIKVCDFEKMKQLVASGVITQATHDSIVFDQKRPARITIQEQKHL